MMIVQRANQQIDYPAMIGWGLVFFFLLSPFAFLTAHVVMRPLRMSKAQRQGGSEDAARMASDYWGR
jgi:hypothetical protein